MKTALFLALLATPALAQLPDAPRPVPVPKIDRALAVTDFSVRMNDAFATWENRPAHCLNCYESNLPQAMANSLPAMLAYGAAVSGSVFVASTELRKHHHPKLARLLPIADIAYDGFCGFGDYRKAKYWK